MKQDILASLVLWICWMQMKSNQNCISCRELVKSPSGELTIIRRAMEITDINEYCPTIVLQDSVLGTVTQARST